MRRRMMEPRGPARGAGKNHHDLIVWQRGVDLVVWIYRMTERFPRDEVYGITAQMRRAAMSIPANVAEGSARSTPKDFAGYVSIARGSLRELETCLVVSERLGYISERERQQVGEAILEIDEMLIALRRSLTTPP